MRRDDVIGHSLFYDFSEEIADALRAGNDGTFATHFGRSK